MQISKLHNWDLSYKQAVELQQQLAGKVKFVPLKRRLKLIAGLDCAFSKDGQRIVAAAVVLKIPEKIVIPAQAGIHFELVEKATATRKVTFPYIPGLLSFREAPVCIAAVEKLKTNPDIFIIDGQGIAHPRRLGLAAHLGLFFDRPTIGCAKSRLTGTFQEPSLEKGAYTLLKDKKAASCGQRDTSHEIIGAVVRTRTNVKPVFVSVGNRCLLEDAIKVVLTCAVKYRLPEPTRLAHGMVSKIRLKA